MFVTNSILIILFKNINLGKVFETVLRQLLFIIACDNTFCTLLLIILTINVKCEYLETEEYINDLFSVKAWTFKIKCWPSKKKLMN